MISVTELVKNLELVTVPHQIVLELLEKSGITEGKHPTVEFKKFVIESLSKQAPAYVLDSQDHLIERLVRQLRQDYHTRQELMLSLKLLNDKKSVWDYI